MLNRKLILAAFLAAPSLAFAQGGPTCNSTPIVIGETVSNGSPYPSAITAAGQPTVLTTVEVTLNNFSHTFPDDLAIALVSPGGQAFLLVDGVTDGEELSGVTFTISDAGATQLPDDSDFGPGTYRPAAYYTGDSFPAPGPGTAYANPGPAGAGTATLNGTYAGINPNGTWNLFVRDFAGGDGGSIEGGWCIAFSGTPVSLQQFSID